MNAQVQYWKSGLRMSKFEETETPEVFAAQTAQAQGVIVRYREFETEGDWTYVLPEGQQ